MASTGDKRWINEEKVVQSLCASMIYERRRVMSSSLALWLRNLVHSPAFDAAELMGVLDTSDHWKIATTGPLIGPWNWRDSTAGFTLSVHPAAGLRLNWHDLHVTSHLNRWTVAQ